MQNKQINDTSYGQSSRLSNNEPPIHVKLHYANGNKLKGVQHADSITFKEVAQLKSAKKQLPLKDNQKPQLKSPSLMTSSIMRQQVPTTLPITINQLQQKTLNQYLKQFMQINRFQSTQKGKQLIDLLKQSPNSKQAQWTVNKLIKLFKSNIPQAVLCSFQFIRELIEIGSDRIVQMFEEALLMPIVQIIEYRSYVPSIQRGNGYFLSGIYRYGADEKTNHLIKIGQTFFKMVHEALYVWGNIYFPQSNFNKMLNRLINKSKITFPQYPYQFKFYSQARIELFLKLMETKRMKVQKSIEKEPVIKKSESQQKQIERIITPQKQKQKPSQNKSITRAVQQKNEQKSLKSKSSTSIKHQESLHDAVMKGIQQQSVTKKKIQQSTEKINSISLKRQQSPLEFKQKQKSQKQSPILSTPKYKQKIAQSSQIAKNQQQVIKSKQQEDELDCIELKKPLLLRKQGKQQIGEIKTQQGYKKHRPSKVKQKRLSIPVLLKRQVQSQISINLSNLEDIEDPLHLISRQQNINVRKARQQLEINNQHKEANIINRKSEIPKQSLKIDLSKLNGNIQQSSSVVVQKIAQHPTPQGVNYHQTNNHTFRPDKVISQSQKAQSSERQRYIIGEQYQSSQGIQTNRMQSTQRQRFNFNYQITEELEDKTKNTTQRSNPNSGRFQQTNVVTEFLKKEFETLKNTIIYEIKKDIISTIQSATTQNKQHVNFDMQKKIVNDQEILGKSSKNQTHKNSDPHSGRFGEKTNQNINPSAQAMQFIKRKISNRKKLRATSRRRIHSLAKDLQVNEKENEEKPSQNNKKQHILRHENKPIHKLVQSGVNTEQLTNQKLYQELTLLRKEINIATSDKQNVTNNFASSNKMQNGFVNSRLISNLFYKTPNTINKNQGELEKSSQFSSLRSTCNSLRKRSNSKLSERRSSAESIIIQKALLKPENCQNQLQEIFGGPNTLLFNAALNSVKKKRPSIMFC